MKVVIFDLDGTLANIDKRRDKARKGKRFDWDAFFHPDNIALDEPNHPVIDLYNMCVSSGYRNVIFSGRSDISEQETRQWLSSYLEGPLDLTMRRHGDYTKDAELKKSWLLDRFELEEIHFVVDDRDSVVQMWRELGLTCFQVDYGGF
ncbi:hypothetical protein AB2B38_008325 [Balneola sp. MJW-20]|uniref:phosphatase domain-containing protein n=1 Tax=Gracilimonas aurantiaca TaxID=3234185 RepID=UPI00390C2CEA